MKQLNSVYERDVTTSRTGRWLANIALLTAILAIAPSFLYIFASALIYLFGFIVYVVANIGVIVITLGLILLSGEFPPISWDEFFGGFTTDQILGSIATIIPVYLPVMAAISCATAILAIIICKRKIGIAGSKGAVKRSVAAFVIIALAIVMTVIALVVGGGV